MKRSVRHIRIVLDDDSATKRAEIIDAVRTRLVHRDDVEFEFFDISNPPVGKSAPEDIVLTALDCQRMLCRSVASEVGCDEAGRGCLAGPVFAAAVILPDGFYHPLLNDSKQMTEIQRNELRSIIESEALAWSVQAVDAKEIDTINILNASIVGMQRAISSLNVGTVPEMIYVDGNKFKPYKSVPYKTVVKGDGKLLCIAAASVLAKTHRDEYMRNLAREYPGYGWDRNVGYPTKEHRQAIEKYGVTPYHRMSYKLLNDDATLF